MKNPCMFHVMPVVLVLAASSWAVGERSCMASGPFALPWLAKQQNADGSWQFDDDSFANPGKWKSKTGATGAALLAFLGAYQTHKEGKYKANVQRGIDFLLKQMETTPWGGDLRGEGGELLWHAMATLALCEAYAQTHDKKLHAPVQQAVDFICALQDRGGGWAPAIGRKPSTQVTAWQVMAIKSAHLAYLRVPPTAIKKTSKFLDAVQVDRGARYGETSSKNGGNASTVAGLLCRRFAGWKRDNPALERGVARLSKLGPSKNDILYTYFGQQVMRRQWGPLFKKWNNNTVQLIVDAQVATGPEAGSWFNPNDVHAADGGRLFQTVMNMMVLEARSECRPRPDNVEDMFPE